MMKIKIPKPAGFDFRSLAFFRIILGLVLIFNLFLRTSGGRLQAHYTNDGVMPFQDYINIIVPFFRHPFFESLQSVQSMRLVFGCLLLICVCFTAGFLTRFFHFLILMILTLLMHRNPFLDDGSDWVMRLILCWTLFLPLDRYFSIASWNKQNSSSPAEDDCKSLAYWGLLGNLVFCYFLNTSQKITPGWKSGFATYEVLWNGLLAKPEAVFFRTHLPAWIWPSLTRGVILAECSLGFLLLVSPFSVNAKRLSVLLMIALHVSMCAGQELGTFCPLFVAVAFLFIPGQDWDRLGFRRKGNEKQDSLGMRIRRIAVSGFIFCFIWANAGKMIQANAFFPASVKTAAAKMTPPFFLTALQWFNIHQGWHMFIQYPRVAQNWILAGTHADSSEEIDLLRAGKKIDFLSFLKRAEPLNKYWCSFLISSIDSRKEFLLGNYFRRKGIEEVTLYQIHTSIPPPGQKLGGPVMIQPVYRNWMPFTHDFKLADISEVSAASAPVQQGMNSWGRVWKNEDQIFLNSEKAGESILIIFQHGRAGRQNVYLYFSKAPDYGIFDIHWNGEFVKKTDLYDPLMGLSHREWLGMLDVRGGANEIKIVNAGKNSRSPAYRLGFDCLGMHE